MVCIRLTLLVAVLALLSCSLALRIGDPSISLTGGCKDGKCEQPLTTVVDTDDMISKESQVLWDLADALSEKMRKTLTTKFTKGVKITINNVEDEAYSAGVTSEEYWQELFTHISYDHVTHEYTAGVGPQIASYLWVYEATNVATREKRKIHEYHVAHFNKNLKIQNLKILMDSDDKHWLSAARTGAKAVSLCPQQTAAPNVTVMGTLSGEDGGRASRVVAAVHEIYDTLRNAHKKELDITKHLTRDFTMFRNHKKYEGELVLDARRIRTLTDFMDWRKINIASTTVVDTNHVWVEVETTIYIISTDTFFTFWAMDMWTVDSVSEDNVLFSKVESIIDGLAAGKAERAIKDEWSKVPEFVFR